MNNKNPFFQRIKPIKKNNNLDGSQFLVKYYQKKIQKENNKPMMCIEREINIPKKLSKEILKEGEKEEIYKNMKNKFEKEMKLVKKFSHPNIIKIIDYLESPDNIFHIIYENYQCDLSETIENQFNKKKYFSESIILSFFTQICLGIKYIHDLNILHRNINPSNILLISNKIIKISNFDFSRILYTENERSITFIINSCNDYISPEMIMNIPYSFKNDIWALGFLLFHMMALKVPFNNKQLNEIHITKKVDPIFLLNKIPKHFSNEIKSLCLDLLKAYPAERPDINSILTKYRIIQNQVKEIQKIHGNNLFVQSNIKNINKSNFNLNFKMEERNKNNNTKYKPRFNSICSNYIKIEKKNSNNKVKSKKKTNLSEGKEKKKDIDDRLSIYQNIQERVKDPNNIMDNYIYGEIINIPDNSESIDINNFKNISNNNKKLIESKNNNSDENKEILKAK